MTKEELGIKTAAEDVKVRKKEVAGEGKGKKKDFRHKKPTNYHF